MIDSPKWTVRLYRRRSQFKFDAGILPFPNIVNNLVISAVVISQISSNHVLLAWAASLIVVPIAVAILFSYFAPDFSGKVLLEVAFFALFFIILSILPAKCALGYVTRRNKDIRIKLSKCIKCGYSLEGIGDLVRCPECGSPIQIAASSPRNNKHQGESNSFVSEDI